MYEYLALLGMAAACLGSAEPGHFSIDHATGNRLNSPAMMVGAFAASTVGAMVVLRQRAQVVGGAGRFPGGRGQDGRGHS